MTRRIIPLSDFVTAGEAAFLLSDKLGRQILPDYIRKIKNVRSQRLSKRCTLYHRDDIMACKVRKRESKHE